MYQQEHSLDREERLLYWSWDRRCWGVGRVLGGAAMELSCPADTPRPQQEGWQYWRWDEWREDPSLRLVAGCLAPAPRVLLEATGQGAAGHRDCLGEYCLQDTLLHRLDSWAFLMIFGGSLCMFET